MGKLRVAAWERIGASQTVLQWITQGVKIQFSKEPTEIELQNRVKGVTQEVFVTRELDRLVQEGAISECKNFKPKCVLPITVVPKKNGKLRLVLDCRHTNGFMSVPKFSQEGIESVAQQIQCNDRMISVDLKNGFHHVGLHKESRKYLGMCWNGVYYVWDVLPFGAKMSPFVFNKCLRPVVTYLRNNGLRVSLFVDDFFQMAQQSLALHQRDFLLDTLKDLGWDVNFEKSQLEPATSCVFIGYRVHSVGNKGPWIQVLPEKVRKLKKVLRYTLNRFDRCVSARCLARIAGQCIAMMRAVLPAKLLLRNVYRTLSNKKSWEDKLWLNEQCVQDLNWWLGAITNWNGAPLNVKQPEIQIETDASGTGYGAVVHAFNSEVSGLWTRNVRAQSSNFRELLAVHLSIQSLRHLLRGKSVQVLSDNVTAVAYLNHLRGHNELLNNLTRSIFMQCQDLSIDLTARHLSGNLNQHADFLSRIQSPYDWRLDNRMFQVLDLKFGPHTIDRFAAATNAHLTVFNSLYHDPYTSGVDALAQGDWKDHNNFVNPPLFLLPKIIDKVIQDQALATIVAPVWKAQPWFHRLCHLLRAPPVKIPKSAVKGYCPEVLKNPRWTLYAWPISGGIGCVSRSGRKTRFRE